MSNTISSEEVLNFKKSVYLGVQEICMSVLGLEPEAMKPIDEKINLEEEYGITGIMGFGGQVKGNFYLKSDLSFACLVAKRMLGLQEINENDDAVKDAYGEFLNMVVGSAKTNYSSIFDQFKISLPTIVCGKDYVVHVKNHAGEAIITLKFKLEDYHFRIEILLEDIL